MGKVVLVVVNFGILAGYVVGSGLWVASGSAWYNSLDKPAWQPPDFVFGLAWPYNFAMLAVVATLIALNASVAERAWWTSAFAASVVAALAWANLFYVQQSLPSAALALALAAAFTVPMVVMAFRYNLWAGVAMLPYLAWLCVATSLAIGYAALNKVV
jgi:translocator protein